VTAAERIATVGGLGRLAPAAPGTLASVLTLLLAWGLVAVHGQLLVLVASIATTAVGFWGAELYARERKARDPSECVVDEVAGQFVACAFVPRTLLTYALAFLFFRLFDIIKPWPISAAERLPGGLGIMADDVIAGLFAGVIALALLQLPLLG
jgi:phosphatidylglycerophosphatase A